MKIDNILNFFQDKTINGLSRKTGVGKPTLRAIRAGENTRILTLEKIGKPYGKEIEIRFIDDSNTPEAA